MQRATRPHADFGATLTERYRAAAAAGYGGLELEAAEVAGERLYDVAEALQASGLRLAALHLGRVDGLLASDIATREAAIDRLRQALNDAADLQAPYLVCVPQVGASEWDVTTEAAEIARLLRNVNDLALAMGVTLLIQAHADCRSLRTLAEGAAALAGQNWHASVQLAADWGVACQTEHDPAAALRQHADHIRYVRAAAAHAEALADVLPHLPHADWLMLA